MPGGCVKVKESTDNGSSTNPFVLIAPKGRQSISVGMLAGCLSVMLQMQCFPGCELVYNNEYRWTILKEMGKDINKYV